MSDTPTPPAGGAEGGAAGGDREVAGDETPWYSKPTTWVVLALLLAALLAVFLLNNDDDSGDNNVAVPSSSSTSSSTVSSTTSSSVPASTTSTSTPSEATTTTEGGTDTGETPGVTPVAISESAVKAAIDKNTPDADLPFEDGDIEANWYTWEDRFVVVYAGWDATATEPLCPGNSLESGGAFDFISNSPAGDRGCDPEDAFDNVVSGDDGARVCEGLVLYRTIIPVEGSTGTLYGSIEKADGGTIIGATSRAPIDSGELTELDPTADAYTVPDGWLDGTTEVTC